MRKLSGIILILSMALSLNGCVKQQPGAKEEFLLNVKVGEIGFRELSDGKLIAETAANEVIPGEECREKFPELVQTLEKINAENVSAEKENLETLAGYVYEIGETSHGSFPSGFESRQDVTPVRADSSVLSYLESNMEFTGGAHPLHGEKGMNFDPETGKELQLTDVLTDTSAIKDILTEKLREKYGDELYPDFEELIAEYAPENINWTVDYEGIDFLFNPYEIAPYAAGSPRVKLWFDEGLVNKKYLSAPRSGWLKSIPLYNECMVDMDTSDGRRDTISIFPRYAPDEGYATAVVKINGNEFTDEQIWGYEFESYYVVKDGKSYLIVCSVADNDYSTIHLAEIVEGVPSFNVHMSGFGFSRESGKNESGEDVFYRDFVNNTENIRLSTRLDILGTRMGRASFRLNTETGSLDMTDADYAVESDYPVTATAAIEAQKQGENCEIPAGTVLYPVRTDGKSYIDMKSEEGTLYRVETDCSGYPVKVNGKPETDCFSGIMYAG